MSTKAIERLRADHLNMARLLHLLEAEVDAFEQGEVAQYDLIGDIVDYMLNYPDLCHHPVENQIYRLLAARVPAQAKAARAIEDEHGHIAEMTRRFAAAVHNVAAESQVPRDWFAAIAREFVQTMRDHMKAEETMFFPLALSHLTAADWKEVDAKLKAHTDPMSAGTVGDSYRALHRRLTQLDQSERRVGM